MTQPYAVSESLFVDRAAELAEFDALLGDLQRGVRRHLALLGLRRIGKTVLLDEVRRRHPNSAIAYLALDEVVSTPEDFARALAGEVLRVAARVGGHRVAALSLGPDDAALRDAAAVLGQRVAAATDALLVALQPQGVRAGTGRPKGAADAATEPGHAGRNGGPTPSYGALLMATMRFPAAVTDAVNVPIVVMLDEFQEIARLRAFSGTDNLLGTLRAALDRPGRIAFVVAGSRVTALRSLLGDGENPLFTRFEQLELRPFPPDATDELATRLWDEEGMRAEPDATVRLQRLTGGWPFYVHAVASRARQIARAGDRRISDQTIDLAFRQELVGRAAAIGQYCRYLLDTALRTDGGALRNPAEAVLRQTARHQPLSRGTLERRLRRHHPHTTIHSAVNRLIDNDFMREEGGMLALVDPVFALWLNLEEVRRDPDAAVQNPPALRRLLTWYEAQHQQDRTEMGTLFERRVENVVRQFRGQVVPGVLFGVEGDVRLPATTDAGPVRVDDPDGRLSAGADGGATPDSYELDVVSAGERAEDHWAVEAKHRRGAITAAMVDRFVRSARAVERARGVSFARLWIVAPRGVRPDATVRIRETGLLASGLRQLERLERLLAGPQDVLSRGR